jgi:hypothetical protein
MFCVNCYVFENVKHIRSDVTMFCEICYVLENVKHIGSAVCMFIFNTCNVIHVLSGRLFRNTEIQNESFLYFKMPAPYTLAGFDLTTHSSSLLGGRRRR